MEKGFLYLFAHATRINATQKIVLVGYGKISKILKIIKNNIKYDESYLGTFEIV